MSNKKLEIVNEFRYLVDNLNYSDTLSLNLFNIIKKYVSYDVAGLYYSESEEDKINNFYLSLPNNNISLGLTDEIRDKFFDKMEEYKDVYEIQCSLVDGDVAEKSRVKYDSFKTIHIVPFVFGNNLAGGFFLASKKALTQTAKDLLEFLSAQMETLLKIKYMLSEQSKHLLIDPMTQLYNRQEFDNSFDMEFNKARRYVYNFTIVMLDIDYLGKINEEHGTEFGDFIIAELSRILKQVFRKTDPVYRYDGGQLAIMLPFTPITKAIIPIERLRSAISEHLFVKDGIEKNITISVGLCANYSKFTEPEQLLESVNTALSRAKERGRNKVDIFE